MSKYSVHWSKLVRLGGAFAFALLLSTDHLKGDIVNAESDGYGVQVQAEVLSLLSVDLLNLTPSQVSSGVAPPAYSFSASGVVVDATVDTSIGPIAGTTVGFELLGVDGLVDSSATSTADGLPGFRTTSGFGGVNGLDLNVANAVVSTPLGSTDFPFLNISADTINSTSTIEGDYGALNAAGESVIQNLAISVNDVQLDIATLLGANGTIDGSGFITVDPNTEILSLGGIVGLDLIFNQQLTTGDGISTLGMETNAISISFNGVDLGLPLIDQALNGSTTIGHSFASVSAVPEPGSTICLAFAVCMVAASARRRRNV